MRLIHGACFALFLAVLTACEKDSPPLDPVFLEIIVEADPGERLSAVSVRVDGEALGQTGYDGALRTRIFSAPGRVHEVAHECPVGYLDSQKSKSIRMRRYASDQPMPIQLKLECRPLTRIAAFIVRAKNGPGLPVSVNGERVTTTNSFGVAHFSRSGPAGTEYVVELDASDHPTLLPRSAATLVTAPDSNELFIITPSFQSVDRVKKQGSYPRKIIKIE